MMAHKGRLRSRRHINQRKEQVAAWYGKNCLVTCIRCNQTGYRPELQNRSSIKQHFKPMIVNNLGVCEVCQGVE